MIPIELQETVATRGLSMMFRESNNQSVSLHVMVSGESDSDCALKYRIGRLVRPLKRRDFPLILLLSSVFS